MVKYRCDDASSRLLVLILIVSSSQLGTCRALIGDNVHEYLMEFGYLPQSDRETGNLRSEEQLKDALRNLQAFAGLPTTGIMDPSTDRLLHKPRCGLPDVVTSSFRSKRYTLHGQKWHYTNLTWSLRTPSRQLNSGHVRRELHRALNLWQEHSKLNFTEIDSDNADILVHFLRGSHDDSYPFDGPGQILAHAFFPGAGRGGDAHFDDEEKWMLHGDTGSGTSLFNVAAHEFGHSLGLSHSSVQGALMYPWYQGVKPGEKYTLPQDDQVGIQQLYGARGRLWGNMPTLAPRTTTTTTTTRRPSYPRTTPKPTRPNYTPRPPYTERPPYRPKPPPSPPKDSEVPDTCDTSYDAISVIRGETFIFKGVYFWRIDDKGLKEGYPVLTSRFWRDLPSNFTHVDAVYERPDRKIVFFIDDQYWVYNANMKEDGYPRPLTDLGLQPSIKKIDGAMIWGHNGKTYFFSATMYWRFDEETQKVELDYPREMSMWDGVDYHIDAVFKWKDGITYFFKGKSYWKFNDQKMRVESQAPMLSAPFWMGCPTKMDEPSVAEASERNLLSASSATPSLRGPCLLVILSLHWISTLRRDFFPPD